MSAHSTGHPHATSGTPARGHGGRAPVLPLPSTSAREVPRARLLQRIGRYGVLLLPVFAVLAIVAQRSPDASSLDPAEYARYLSTVRYRPVDLAATAALGACCVLSAVFLAMLLVRGRGRWCALSGAALAVLGAATMLLSVGGVVIRAERLRTALLHLRLADLDINAGTTSTGGALVVLVGAVLLTVGWMALGVALLLTRGANIADGVLLVISAPMLYLGGMVLRVLPSMGGFVLLAAALGIVFTGGRGYPQAPRRRRAGRTGDPGTRRARAEASALARASVTGRRRSMPVFTRHGRAVGRRARPRR